MDRTALAARDADDPILRRERFELPDALVYLDGNSLGPPARRAQERVTSMLAAWRDDQISAWNRAGWVHLADETAARIAPLLGADRGEVAVTDSTSVDLFQTLVAACRARPDRPVLLIEQDGFPTDRYVAEAVASLLGRSVRQVPRDTLTQTVDDDVAVVTAAHVDYRSGHRLDAVALGRAARGAGAMTVWDLAHTTGALDVDLHAWDADFAVGCTYKFLNGGPGAPGYVYVAGGLDPEATIRGWWGHGQPFAFSTGWEPAAGAARFRNGSPPILAMQPLLAALDVFDGVAPRTLQERATALTTLFIDLVDERIGDAVEVASPRDAALRGAQVSLRHPSAYAVMQALIDRGVIGDHRPPDLLRFGFAPLHTRWTDVWDGIETLRHILASGVWEQDRYAARNEVP